MRDSLVATCVLILVHCHAAVFGAQQEHGLAQFEKLRDADGAFEIMMPANPQRQVQKAGEGPNDVQYQFLSGGPNGVYLIGYQDHPDLNSEDPEVRERSDQCCP